MKSLKLSLIAAIAATTLVTTSVVADSGVSISANVAATSNYVWRGMTQTNNAPAVQGGIDFGYNGFYAGVWGSNISWTTEADSTLEADFYAGYAGEFSGIGYDLGYIRYAYPKAQDSYNFDEVYLALSKDFGVASISAKYSKQVDGPTGYEKLYDIEGTISTSLPQDIGLDLTYGKYEKNGKRVLVGLSKTYGKFDLSLAYSDFKHDTNSASDEDHIIATISTSF